MTEEYPGRYGDFKLVYEEDDIIGFYFDDNNWTRVRRDHVSQDHPYGDGQWKRLILPSQTFRSMWELANTCPEDLPQA